MHSLLKRQINRYFGQIDTIPEEWKAVINAVSDAYHQMDRDREMLERSLELSSKELLEANSEMRAIFQTIPDLLFRLDLEGTILDFKAGSTSDFLIKPKIVYGQRIQDITFREISNQFQEAIDRLRTDKSLVRIEYTIIVTGEKNFYEARLLPLFEDQIIAIIRNISERKRAEEDRERLITDLQIALSDVRKLSGLLPICASCKKIRDDNGYWNQLESYIKEHSEAEFSHSICPECVKVLYPDYYEKTNYCQKIT